MIMGRLIPAGTGLDGYAKLASVVDPALLEEDEEYDMNLSSPDIVPILLRAY